MTALSSKTLNYGRIIFLLAISFMLLNDPMAVTELPLVIILTQSMQLPIVELNEYSPVFGIISVLFLVIAFSDLIPLMGSNVAYFESAVPFRLFLFFGLATYCYVGSSFYICNGLVFVYSFAEVWFNFLIYAALRDEKYVRDKAQAQKERQTMDELLRGDRDPKESEELLKSMEEEEFNKIMQQLKEDHSISKPKSN